MEMDLPNWKGLIQKYLKFGKHKFGKKIMTK